VLAGACVTSLVLACNGIIGLSDCRGGECSGGGVCGDAGGFDVSVVGASDGGASDAMVDASGTLPVSWAAWPMPNYDAGGTTDNPMGYTAVTDQGWQDNVTKLVWRHPMPVEANNATYEQALQICAAPWRLPSRIELVTLLDLSQSGARVNPVFKSPSPGMQQGAHWTFSEVRPFDPAKREHWVVDFGGGGLAKRAELGDAAAVRCVKGGT